MKDKRPKIAIVYDWANQWGGAERILVSLADIYPEADLYVSVWNKDKAKWVNKFARVYPSFLNKLPTAQKKHYWFFPLLPLAFESFRLGFRQAMFSPSSIQKVEWIMGAFMLLRADVFRQTGGFDERMFMYMEEVEWCYRIAKSGFKIGFYPNAKIVHIGRGSSKGEKRLPIVNIYKGLVYFYCKHRGKLALLCLRLMLRLKAVLLVLLGTLLRNDYLKKTYREALGVC